MKDEAISAPKVFISYSWSNAEYEERVMRLARDLVELGGIDVVIDKWSLPEGADLFAFMESAVVDKSITKVLILLDKSYAEKANGREGGVGRETQIITPQIYKQDYPEAKEKRFIPIVMEKDEEGKAYLPVYLEMRRYIDMSTDDLYNGSFEQLVRACFDKPLNMKPKLGSIPGYILQEDSHSLGTRTLQQAAIQALNSNNKNSISKCKDYFEKLAEMLSSFDIRSKIDDKNFDEIVFTKIQEMKFIRDESIELISHMINSLDEEDSGNVIHDFFENIAEYTSWPPDSYSWSESSSDNYRFFIYELFLYIMALAINSRKPKIIEILLEDYYYRYSRNDYRLNWYVHFQKHIQTLEVYYKRQDKNYSSNEAVLIKERFVEKRSLRFEHIMQADMFLFLHSRLSDVESYDSWFPCTMAYAVRRQEPFEIFAKAQYKKHCKILLKMLGVDSLEKIRTAFAVDESMNNFRFGYSPLNRVNVEQLIGLELLGTRD